MGKIAFKMKLRPGYKEEYKRRHDAIWPELKVLLKESGISDYSIYLDDETNMLFAVQSNSGKNSSQDLAGNEIIKRWWKYFTWIDFLQIHSLKGTSMTACSVCGRHGRNQGCGLPVQK